MRSELLHVITCVSNPIRWASRIRLFHQFAGHMAQSGVQLTVVECALGERPFELDGGKGIPSYEHIGVRAKTLAWNKECLINLGVARSRIRTPYVAWIDADIEFRRRDWAVETVHALQQYRVVQPWGDALDLGPRGEPMMVKGVHVQPSFGRVWHEQRRIEAQSTGGYGGGWWYPHPGYAWAIRREVLDGIGGLLEVSGLGAGDHQMAMAFIGQFGHAIHSETTRAYQEAVLGWGRRAHAVVQGDLGYVPGTVEHQWHGSKAKRRYQERWSILVEHGFDPVTDLRRNLDGVVELAGNKPAMTAAFDRYFRERDEDANIVVDA